MRFHSPYQIGVEFDADLAEFSFSWIPVSVSQSADAVEKTLTCLKQWTRTVAGRTQSRLLPAAQAPLEAVEVREVRKVREVRGVREVQGVREVLEIRGVQEVQGVQEVSEVSDVPEVQEVPEVQKVEEVPEV